MDGNFRCKSEFGLENGVENFKYLLNIFKYLLNKDIMPIFQKCNTGYISGYLDSTFQAFCFSQIQLM